MALEPKDLSQRKDFIELSRKGGLSKSPRKALASRINGLVNSKNLDSEQRYMLGLLKEKRFLDIILELISHNLEDYKDPRRRDKLIEQLCYFIPTKNISMELSTKYLESEENVNLLVSAISEVCPEKLSDILAKVEVLKNERDVNTKSF